MTESNFSLGPPGDDEMTLLDLADRLLNRGVVLTGEATISVAGVDLIYLGLNVVLSAVSNLKKAPGAASQEAPGNAAAAARDRGS